MPIIFILLWSSGYIFIDMGLQTNGSITFVMLRLFFSLLIVAIILLFQRSRFFMPWKQSLQIGVSGLFSQGFYQLFAFLAMDNGVSPGFLAIVLGAQPIATALITRESLSTIQRFGLILGLMGLSLTVSNVLFFNAATSAGILFCFLSLFGITVGTILQKKYCSHTPLVTNMFLQYCSSFSFAFILYLTLGNHHIRWTESFVISLSWMVVVISIASTFLFYYLLRNRKIVNFTSYLYCVPPTTALMDYFIFHHVLSKISILGMVFVLIGMGFILKRPSIPLQTRTPLSAGVD